MNRHLWKGMSLLLVALLAMTGCAGGTSDDGDGAAVEDPDDVVTAEQLYDNNCASCHGGNLEGAMGPSLETVGAKYSQDEIVDILDNGIGQMQPQNQLSDDEKEELASWLAEKK